MARRPQILLFDEPLTNVDSASKYRFQRAFKTLTRTTSQTIVYVTHDQTEAMTLADQIALMEKGRIIQYDSPRKVYSRPENTFAGWFLGDPGMNFIRLGNGRAGGLDEFVLSRLHMSAETNATPGLTFGIRAGGYPFERNGEERLDQGARYTERHRNRRATLDHPGYRGSETESEDSLQRESGVA